MIRLTLEQVDGSRGPEPYTHPIGTLEVDRVAYVKNSLDWKADYRVKLRWSGQSDENRPPVPDGFEVLVRGFERQKGAWALAKAALEAIFS